MLEKLVTPKGYEFWAESLVTINGVDYALNEMKPEQKAYVCAVRDINGLNAAFAGERVYSAKLPPFEEVFADILAGEGHPAEYQWPKEWK